MKKVTNFVAIVVMTFALTQIAKASCWGEAGAMYNQDTALLKAIAWKESKGKILSVGSLLPDGNRAIGLMQINTIHMPMLRKYGITEQDLFNPCVSQKVGAFILADCMTKFGRTWRAVGCYYGGPKSRAYTAMNGYANDVRRYYEGYKRQQLRELQVNNYSSGAGE